MPKTIEFDYEYLFISNLTIDYAYLYWLEDRDIIPIKQNLFKHKLNTFTKSPQKSLQAAIS
jgi:hypothetical protein